MGRGATGEPSSLRTDHGCLAHVWVPSWSPRPWGSANPLAPGDPAGPLPAIWGQETREESLVQGPRVRRESRRCRVPRLWGPPFLVHPMSTPAHGARGVDRLTSGEPHRLFASQTSPPRSSGSWPAKRVSALLPAFLVCLRGSYLWTDQLQLPRQGAALSGRRPGLLLPQLCSQRVWPGKTRLYGGRGRPEPSSRARKEPPRPKSRPPPMAPRSVLRTSGKGNWEAGEQKYPLGGPTPLPQAGPGAGEEGTGLRSRWRGSRGGRERQQ